MNDSAYSKQKHSLKRLLKMHDVSKSIFFRSLMVIFLITSILISSFSIVKADSIPQVTLLTPTPGSIIKKQANISWDAYDITGLPLNVFLYYLSINDNEWKRINQDPLSNTGFFCWNCSNINDGPYKIVIQVVNTNNYLGMDVSEPFTIDNDNSPMKIEEINIYDATTGSNAYIRDDDEIHIIAKISHASHLTKSDISADLRCFNKQEHTLPDSFDGTNAEWIITSVQCEISNGIVSFEINVDNLVQEQIHVTVDSIAPQIEIKDPIPGIYLFKKKIFPTEKIIIIGSIPVNIEASDNYVVSHVRISIEDRYEVQIDSPPWSTTIMENLFGNFDILIEVFDEAGNSDSRVFSVLAYNLF